MIHLPFSRIGEAWIGYNDIRREKHFVWVNPARRNNRYTNWHRGEPNNWGGNEDCTVVHSGGNAQWNDLNCNNKRAFVVEIGRGHGMYHTNLFYYVTS